MASKIVAGTKRKVKPSKLAARKKAKTAHLSVDELPWKAVARPRETSAAGAFDGMLELEEVSDVEVVYEETEAGKIIKFKVAGAIVDEGNNVADVQDVPAAEEPVAGSSTSPARNASTPKEDVVRVEDAQDAPFDALLTAETMLPDWSPFSLHQQLAKALYAQHFTRPTPIQAEALPLALSGRDVVGVAETGSGKTLAYGLPILDHLLKHASVSVSSVKERRPVRALVLTPTRELALQVSSHLNACLNPVNVPSVDVKREEDEPELPSANPKGKGKGKGNGKQKGKSKEKKTATSEEAKQRSGPPPVSVAAIVGGMSAQKQRRLLSRGVDVLVATPGRLWDIIQEDDELAGQIEKLRFLVLDEADRMIETGHFAEMENILRLTLRQSKDDEIEPEPTSGSQDDEDEAGEAEDSKAGVEGEMQTFVFSATLSKDLQKNLKRPSRSNRRKKGKPASTLDDLLMRLDFRDPTPAVIDIAPEGGAVATLQESKIGCLSGDKDAYLYYFLLRYPGRTLVFLSSIDGIRRLLPTMSLLDIPAFPSTRSSSRDNDSRTSTGASLPFINPLRIRPPTNLRRRFKSTARGVLLATDVAARGLDVPAVDHVVHYQVPRTADAYVHRNGRTARAARKGFSLLMVAPDERRVVRALMGSLKREEDEIPEMPVELYMLDRLKARVQLAREIDVAQHKVRTEKHDINWLKEAAEAMEIELDSGLETDEQESVPSKAQRKYSDAKVAGLKAKLKGLLAQPLVARGVSTRYITSGAVSIADDMLTGNFNETMVGLQKVEAGSDLVAAKIRKSKSKAPVKEEFEEWGGIAE
ncbi:P-loop containing nucleoside triphosphate hydrolase protein [Fomitopsis serialis]|uniref:P-loop containing nucleoside triphosphate hydrolase protein n=1 Tax=Fomitopsis serialis TaxID=139415 RepID=UPI002007467E|nr:P-loop containing nucleoside triphosphate hydrolase protein [Neoantrodia serialis]KAH9922487.1 P-loop containing nucleoside triphosphate hydrolase protein [Neoantrodia serialis]